MSRYNPDVDNKPILGFADVWRPFDSDALNAYLRRELPAYAVPVFLRAAGTAVDTTGTFKHQKSKLKEEGFDVNRINNPVYVLLPGEKAYQRLTADVAAAIVGGEYRF